MTHAASGDRARRPSRPAASRRAPLAVRFPGTGPELELASPAWSPPRAGPPPWGRSEGSGWGSGRAPALSSLGSGEWSRRPRTPRLPAAGPAPPTLGCRLGAPHPKSQRLRGSRGARAKPGSRIPRRLRAPRPCPAGPGAPSRTRGPRPPPGASFLTCAAAEEAGLLGKLCGDGWSLRGYSKERAGTGAGGRPRGPGRGAPGARRNAAAGPGRGARGGASARLGRPAEPRGACAGVRPAAGVRVAGWVRSAGRGPAAVLARAAAAASRTRGARLCGRLSLAAAAAAAGAVRAGAEREGGEERGRRRAGRRRRGRGRRAAHWPAGPGAGDCAAARGLGPSPGETASASPSLCPQLKWLGGGGRLGSRPPPRGRGGRFPTASSAGGGGGGKAFSLTRRLPLHGSSPHPLIHPSFQPSIHSFVRPPVHSFTNRYPAPTLLVKVTLPPAGRPFPTRSPHLRDAPPRARVRSQPPRPTPSSPCDLEQRVT